MLQLRYKSLLLLLFSALIFAAPLAPSAQADIFDPQPQTTIGDQNSQTNNSGGEESATGVAIRKLFEILLGLIGLISVVFLMWGAVRFVNAQGIERDITSARNTMFNSIIAINIAILVYALVRILINLFFQT